MLTFQAVINLRPIWKRRGNPADGVLQTNELGVRESKASSGGEFDESSPKLKPKISAEESPAIESKQNKEVTQPKSTVLSRARKAIKSWVANGGPKKAVGTVVSIAASVVSILSGCGVLK